jgi:hypothetical protein
VDPRERFVGLCPLEGQQQLKNLRLHAQKHALVPDRIKNFLLRRVFGRRFNHNKIKVTYLPALPIVREK